jgi:hypothetical protein
MDTADPLIEDILKQVCEKTNLQVFIGNAGRYTTVLCCCKDFTEHIKKELTDALGEQFVKENFHFRTGYLEYV